MSSETPSRNTQSDPPLITASVAGVFAGFGIVAAIGLGWAVARSTAGLAPFTSAGGAAVAVRGAAPSLALPAGPQIVSVIAKDITFEQKALSISGPGPVTFEVENTGKIEHDFTIDSPKVKVVPKPGAKSSAQVTFEKPGTYQFYCSIPGHKEAGMAGTLTVGTGAASSAVAAPAKAQPSPTPMTHASSSVPNAKGNQVLAPVSVNGTVKSFELTAKVVQWEVIPGVFEEAWAYNGVVPGPMIRVNEGDTVRVTVKNELPEDTVVHFHGPLLENKMDGVPDVTQPVIKPGGSFVYEFKATPSGTYMYHTHHNSAVQEPKGLMGMLVIDPAPTSAEAKRDASFQRDYFQILSEFNAGQAPHPMHLHGYHFKVIGVDGKPMPETAIYEKDTLSIFPGERYDIEFLADNPGLWVFHCHILSHVMNQGVEPGGMLAVVKVS
jgi:FtsP/CotA-like multicopper oxidase with cupredoxin domain